MHALLQRTGVAAAVHHPQQQGALHDAQGDLDLPLFPRSQALTGLDGVVHQVAHQRAEVQIADGQRLRRGVELPDNLDAGRTHAQLLCVQQAVDQRVAAVNLRTGLGEGGVQGGEVFVLALVLALLTQRVDGQQMVGDVVAQLAVAGRAVQHGLHLAQLGAGLLLHEAGLLGFADAAVELVDQGEQAQQGDQRQEDGDGAERGDVLVDPGVDFQAPLGVVDEGQRGRCSHHRQGSDGQLAPQLAVQAILDDAHGAAQHQIEQPCDEGAEAVEQQLLNGRDVWDGHAQGRGQPDAEHLGAGEERQPQHGSQDPGGGAAAIAGEGQQQVHRRAQRRAQGRGQVQSRQDDHERQNCSGQQAVQTEAEARLEQRLHQGDVAVLGAEPDEEKGGREPGQGQEGHLS